MSPQIIKLNKLPQVKIKNKVYSNISNLKDMSLYKFNSRNFASVQKNRTLEEQLVRLPSTGKLLNN